MSEQPTSINYDDLNTHIHHLENYARAIIGDTKASPDVLAAYRSGYADGPFAEVGDLLSQGRQWREKVGEKFAEEARNQAQAHRNTIAEFTDADDANTALMNNVGGEH